MLETSDVEPMEEDYLEEQDHSEDGKYSNDSSIIGGESESSFGHDDDDSPRELPEFTDKFQGFKEDVQHLSVNVQDIERSDLKVEGQVFQGEEREDQD